MSALLRSVHRGTVEADGIWFPPGISRLPERVLSCWCEGAALYEAVGWGYVLELPRSPMPSPAVPLKGRPSRIDAQTCPGIVLVRQGDKPGCASYPGCPGLERDCVGLLWHGRAVLLERSELRPVDVGEWIREVFVSVVEGESLARPGGAPALPAPAQALDIRQELRAVPPPSPQLQLFLDSFQKGDLAGSSSGTAAVYAPPGPLARWAAATMDRMRGLLSPDHNQRYLKTMVQLFEGGDLHEALRYGIPLSQLPDPVAQQRFAWLRPRTKLSILPPSMSGGSAQIPVTPTGEAYLKELYRQAAQRLVAADRIEEAVFVFAQLLGDDDTALKLLEEHDMLGLAARLAEARNKAPETRIRLWFLAGDVEQALSVARRTGGWSQAYQELLKRNPARAQDWRWEWGLHLVRGNCHAAAIQLLWPDRAARPEVREWVAPALEAGGWEAGLVLALCLDVSDGGPLSPSTLRQTVREWVAEDDPALQPRLSGLMVGLAGQRDTEPNALVAEVSDSLVRAALKRRTLNHQTFQSLVKRCGDPLLKADLPSYPGLVPSPDRLWTELLEGRGAAPIFDAALMPDGRLLCAMGEAGLLVLSRAGRRIALLPVPTERIVVPTAGDRYLLICPRGAEQRLAWLEGGSLKTWVWATVRLSNFCTEHNGDYWLVVVDSALFQIDVRSTQWRCLWKVPLSAPVESLTNGGHKLGLLLIDAAGAPFAEHYSLPDLQLRSRRAGQLSDDKLFSVSCDGLVEAYLQPQGGLEMLGNRLLFQEPLQGPVRFTHGTRWSVVEARSALRTVVWAVRLRGTGGGVQAGGSDRPVQFFIPHARHVFTRLHQDTLIVGDDLGNCRVADLVRRTWVRNLVSTPRRPP